MRHALELVAEHVVAEVEGDVDRLPKTLVPEPTYRFWGVGGRPGFTGEKGIRAFYDHLIGSGKNRLGYVLSRVVADAATVVTDGVIHHVLDGADLVGRVTTEIEAGHWYRVTYRSPIVWPVDPTPQPMSYARRQAARTRADSECSIWPAATPTTRWYASSSGASSSTSLRP